MLYTVMLMVALLTIDQITKLWAVLYVKPHEMLPGIPYVMHFQYVAEGSGASFGRMVVLVVTCLAILAGLAYLFILKPKDKIERAAVIMVVAGGLGNVIDRIISGHVVKFISIDLFSLPVFNLSDALIIIGFVMLIASTIRQFLRERRRAVASGKKKGENVSKRAKRGRKNEIPTATQITAAAESAPDAVPAPLPAPPQRVEVVDSAPQVF